MRQQEEKERSPGDHAKLVKEMGLRMDDIEQRVASLDKKMDDSHHRLESMLKLLLAKDGLTAPAAEAAVVVAREDNTDVDAYAEDMTFTTTWDKTKVVEEDDHDDDDNSEESGEVREEEVLDKGGLEEVIEGGATEEVPQDGGLEEAPQGAIPSEVLGGAGKEKEPKNLASRPATDVTVQKVLAVATDKPPKDVDSREARGGRGYTRRINTTN